MFRLPAGRRAPSPTHSLPGAKSRAACTSPATCDIWPELWHSAALRLHPRGLHSKQQCRAYLQFLWPSRTTLQALEWLSWERTAKSVSPAPPLCRGSCGREKRDAGCPPSPCCVSGGPCQRSSWASFPGDVPAAAREGSTAGLLPGLSPLLSPSFALQACSGRRGSKLAAAVPRRGKPTRQHSPILTPCLPAPWHQPAPRQAPLSGRSRRGHRLLSPTVAAHLFPGRWRSPDPSPPRTAAPLSQAGPCLSIQRGPVSGPRGLASPCCKSSPCSRAGLRPLQHEATASPEAQAAHWLLGGRASQAFSRDPSPQKRGASQATGLFFRSLCQLPHAAPRPTGRVRPRPCYHPNLTPRAGAACFIPTRLAAARPRCLPCRLLVGRVLQGAI